MTLPPPIIGALASSNGSFVLALKPQEIFDLLRNRFRDIDEIYRVKQNVISRLRRDSDFRKFVGGDD